jgi:hypothetical protein
MKTLTLGTVLVLSAAAQTLTVAGVATDGLRNTPLERARVFLSGGRGGPLALTTAADGKFSFDVPEGKYTLSVDRNGWRNLFGHPEPSVGFGSAIITGPSQDTSHLTLRWYAPGSIFGTVVDEQGEPVRDAVVQLIRDSVAVGRRRQFAAGSARTDDRGEYRLGPLAASTYYIVVTGRPWDAMQRRIPRFGPAGELPEPVAVYPPTYYPGAADAHEAMPIVLKSGGEIQADIPLRSVSGGAVHARCLGMGTQDDVCQGTISLFLQRIGGVEILQPTNSDPAAHSISGVPPGRYILRFTGNGKTGRRVIDVGAGDLSVDLTPQPRTVITGSISFKNGAPKPGASLYVGMLNEITGRSVGVAVEPDGTFRFTGVGGAPFRPNLYGSAAQFIAKISVEGAPFKDGVVDLTESTAVNLKIVASDETGRIKGFAMEGDKPAPAVMVVLAPRTESHDPANYRGFQTESDGSFDYVNIPAGDYLIFAVDRLDIEYTNPEAVRPYLPSAIAVHLSAHGVVEQRVPLSAAPKN